MKMIAGALFATARARSVFPVPGGPYSSTPFGIRAPRAWNFVGSFRKSLISCISSIASSEPATSWKVTVGVSLFTSLARDLPNCMTLLPPPWAEEMRNQKMRPSSRIGSRSERSPSNQLARGTTSLYPSDGFESAMASTTSAARAFT
ncbi:MAG: hypothetical protein K0Q58_1413 [Microbacterium sp.]|nr:hypothetical protein [Microbacterium sp.]